ncbi:MAG: putative transcriptional regulator [Verrucomicrobia bacterium]|nr:putative transcriptional regulator [Verrucomicrobiota bacterium]
MKEPAPTIELIPISRIRVMNPRARDKRRFDAIVQNIAAIGLKRPITLRRHGKDADAHYEVVCGQGRLEAFMALGQSHIPAIVSEYDRKDAMLASLVENIARRPVRAIEQIKSIRWMKENGSDHDEIARKTGLGKPYVQSILRLLENGETRLLDAALHGRIPITIATNIATLNDDESQRILMSAYDAGEIKQKTLSVFKKLVERRKFFGKGCDDRPSRERVRKPSTEQFRSSYRQLAGRQKLMIKKARTCEARLLALTAAFRTLTDDEGFVNLLRAEKIGTMPKFLAERIREGN